MTVTERLMQPGSWTLQLSDAAPRRIRDAVDQLGQLVVLPGHLDGRLVQASDIAAAARFAGRITSKHLGRPYEIGGSGPLSWLSDEQGKGVGTYTGGAAGAADGNHDLTDWLDRILGVPDGPTVTPLTPGSVYGSGPTTTASFSYRPRREALDYIAAALGVEYRVNPNLTVDIGPRASLFRDPPTAIASARGGGPELVDMYGLRTVDVKPTEDVEDYTTGLFAFTEASDHTRTITGTAAQVGAYLTPVGETVRLDRFVSSPNSSGGGTSDDGFAAGELAKVANPRVGLTVTVGGYDVARHVQPGDSLYVWDPDAGLVDVANHVRYRGETLFPVVVRVFAVTWPVQQGMGVYHVAGSGVVTDLTEWVAWESGDTQLEVGAPSRLLA